VVGFFSSGRRLHWHALSNTSTSSINHHHHHTAVIFFLIVDTII
jgi:hypothetical protein